MKLVQFTKAVGSDEKQCYINPDQIECIYQDNSNPDRQTVIQFTSGEFLRVAHAVQFVYSTLIAAK